jgi:ABC-type bacteriocin/lantibiotic exporters, contain an N-terminal double-glycine peptidase domain
MQVFSGLNLRIPGGQQVGVVGLSGAGKSTLASLLMRFDDVDSGSIKIDGIDIRDVRQEELRAQIAYVPQEPLLFHRTIRENLQYFGKDLSEAHMIRAAKAAHAHEFIQRLPEGYDSMVGERGIKLSGGQKQRIVIARAILKNAPIMIFDEATSALDSESEKIIQEALPEILGKRTAIVIAHRLSTVAGLDRIIVMHGGRIVEDGTHEELLKLKGRYYSLWQKQTDHGNSVKNVKTATQKPKQRKAVLEHA